MMTCLLVVQMLTTMQSNLAEVPNFTESCVIPRNYVDPDIPVEQLLQQQNTAPQIPFPHIASPPVNKFQQEQLEEHAFLVLYPKGRFGLGHDRSKHLTDLKYMQSRLFNKYPRWRNSVVWMFWALNTFEMRKLQSEISILSRIKKQTSQLLTAGDIANPSSESLSNSHSGYSCILERSVASLARQNTHSRPNLEAVMFFECKTGLFSEGCDHGPRQTTEYGAAMYVCMYVSKSEPERLKNALHETLQNIPADATQRKRLSMIGATVLTHRQISLQAVVYRLGGFPLVRHTTISANSRYPQNRSKMLKPKNLTAS